ncbi:MAG: rhomboid family intramembrane serine protease [Chloroflexi bacterium]|nr:rhomboid family intramembrane serine protease [Chloroflexota bacterium]
MESNPFEPTPSQPPPGAEKKPVIVSFPTVQPVITYAILVIIGLVFLYSTSLTVADRSFFFERWAKDNDKVYGGEYYRLFTSMFLHLNFLHILFNGWALYLFGRDVESLFGHIRFAIVYFLGGLAGSIGSLLYTEANSIGASGAIFSIFAAMGFYLYRHRHLYGQFASVRLRQMVMLGVINIVFGLSPGTNIDNAAHLGGAIGGFLLAWFISPEYEPRRTAQEQITMVDTNTPEKWAVAPVLFGVGIVATVAYAAAVLG